MTSVLRVLDAVPPGGGAAVMGTGIVSIGLELDQHRTLSRALFGLAVLLWLVLLAALLRRAVRHRDRWLAETRMPDLLSVVAATGVLGARSVLLGPTWLGYVLLAVALCLWIGLVPRVLRNWSTPTLGVSFLLAVATESLAVLTALLAIEHRAGWLAAGSLAPFAVGLVAYVHALVRVDLGQVLKGRGDHWIFGGALAIAALACAEATIALRLTGAIAGGPPGLDDASLALLAAAALWLPALLGGELLSPRLRYHPRRWSTVFPVGMYGVATVATGDLTRIGALTRAGHVFVWCAFGLWAIVFAGLLVRGAGLLAQS